SKHLDISLALNFPLAVAQLKTTGSCGLTIRGHLFDAHWPDHYLRRIRSVAITIPCVKGPYEPINARLTLLKAGIRTDATRTAYDFEDTNGQPLGNFEPNIDDVYRMFAETNNALNDTGRFQFDDEARRMNAFEGGGLDYSEWRLDLSREFNSFEFMT